MDRNHVDGVQLERRERVLPILLVESEAGEHRPGITAGTDERRHARELFRLHERDDSVAGSLGHLHTEREEDERSKCVVPLVIVRYIGEDEEEQTLAEQCQELRPNSAAEGESGIQGVAEDAPEAAGEEIHETEAP